MLGERLCFTTLELERIVVGFFRLRTEAKEVLSDYTGSLCGASRVEQQSMLEVEPADSAI